MIRKLAPYVISLRMIGLLFLVVTLSATKSMSQVPTSGSSVNRDVRGKGTLTHDPLPPRTRRMRRDAKPAGADLFLPAVSYGSGGQLANGIAMADLTGNGKPDLLISNFCDPTCVAGSVGILRGNGDGTFEPAVVQLTGGWSAQAILVVDLNDDGKLDLIVANRCVNFDDCTGAAGVLLGNGDGTFQAPVNYVSGGMSSWSLAVADFNGDHKPDIALANIDSDNVSVLLGNGDGSFKGAVNYPSGGNIAWSVSVADVNLDGKPDLLVANLCRNDPDCEGAIGVMLGNGDGTFQPVVVHDPAGQNSTSIVARDVDGDGKPDLIVANDCGSSQCSGHGTVGVLLGKGDGTFKTAVAYDSGNFYTRSVAVADVNGDGKMDVVAGNYDGTVSILIGNGQGVFQFSESHRIGSGAFGPQSVAIVDVNHDLWPDVMIADGFASAAAVLMNNNGLHSPTTTTLTSSVNPVGVRKDVTYTATVTNESGGPVTRTVAFMDRTATIATVNVSANQASFTVRYKQIGSHIITAVYSGDAANTGSTSAPLTQYVQGPTSTLLTTSGSPSHVGQPVTFTASVTSKYGVVPNGELVTFYDGKKLLGSAALTGSTAAFTTSSLSVNTHAIKAAYAGNLIFKASIGRVSQVVEP